MNRPQTLVVGIAIGIVAGVFMAGQVHKDVDKADKIVYKDIDMNVSAYCPCDKCCGDFADGITASGKPAEGLLIAAPKKYSFGTRMDVPGYGTALVQDRGGAIKGNKIDLLFPSHQEALVWGRQWPKVRVYVN